MPPQPPELTIRTTHAGGTTTLVLEGEIDLLTSTQLNRELDAVLDRVPPPTRLRIELAAVSFMDTTGVAVLLKARRRALESGCRFSCRRPRPRSRGCSTSPGLAGLLTETNGE